jgi:hypothetical protein
MTLRSLNTDGSTIAVGGLEVAVPPPGQGIMRAHLVFRQMRGADDDSPLFLAEHASQTVAATPQAIRRWLRDITVETGVTLTEHYTRHEHESNPRWRQRRGLLLRKVI